MDAQGVPVQSEQLVLAVDDEPAALRVVKLCLREEGFRVLTASSADEALRLAEQYRPDVAVLDVMMPGTDGLELMRELRARSSLPVILLTGRSADRDKVHGLDLGADDYLVKPFNPEELGARIRAVLRRTAVHATTPQVVTVGDLEIDLDRRLVKRAGELIGLTRTEWMLLQHLAANPGKVMLNTELLTKVWGTEYREDFQYLRVWVSRLRRKLGDFGLIRTFQGIGYMLVLQPDARAETVDEPGAEIEEAPADPPAEHPQARHRAS
jgi:DNA-binding response OmpR family regulator